MKKDKYWNRVKKLCSRKPKFPSVEKLKEALEGNTDGGFNQKFGIYECPNCKEFHLVHQEKIDELNEMKPKT